MKRIIVLLITGLSVFQYGCTKEKYEDLPVSRQPYTGDEIRLNGYYYREIKYYDHAQEREAVDASIIFFFANGIKLWGGRYNADNLSEIAVYEEKFRNGVFYTKDDRANWATFFVNDNSITIHGWAHYGNSWRKYKLYKDYMTIIDRDNIRNSRGYVYKFKEFYGKPDSVCRFIP